MNKYRIEKGSYRYRTWQKRKLLILTIGAFAIVGVFVLVGYIQTKTRLNWFTLIAVLGCLPAAKMAVGLITFFPYKSMDEDKYREIQAKSQRLEVLYDLVLTSEERIMPAEAVIVAHQSICGYVESSKKEPKELQRYILKLLNENKIDGITVKIFENYESFLTRVEALETIAETENILPARQESEISRLLRAVSM